MSQSYEQAAAWINAFAGDPSVAILDFRAIHDTNKGIAAIPFRGTLPECWSSIVHYNNQGYGIFAVTAMMDGVGRELGNVDYIRAHFVDLDNLSALQNYEATTRAWPAPAMGVLSSIIYNPDGSEQRRKYHTFWAVQPYRGNERFTAIQRKLRQVFDGDLIIDPTRVMRLAGTLHQKDPARPHLVICWPLAGHGQWHDVSLFEQALAGVNVIDGGAGVRHALGDPDLAAPSLDWLQHALDLTDPNDLDRAGWMGITYCIKQSGWSLTDPDTLYAMWSKWCERYTDNDPAENRKQWDSINSTELGWQSLLRRVPSLQGTFMFNGVQHTVPTANPATPDVPAEAPPMPGPPELDCSGEYLTHVEQAQWFRGCVFVTSLGEILADDGRFLNATKFNGKYGGKKFIIDGAGKQVNEAWQAATRSTLWRVPVVDHVRFYPAAAHGAVIMDDLNRPGVNTYNPVTVRRVKGDVGPFLRHISALFPEPCDQRIMLDYMAHNARFPGHKIPWAPVIQSTEGAGKGVIKSVMQHVMGRPYIYFPNAKELTNSGSQFNAWMANKLFILADEIKVDDRRDLIEVLKPMISEEIIEIQRKGHDQELQDNFANWLFFTNWKDAIPVNANARRFAILYSVCQTAQDLLDRQMGQYYFDALYKWLAADGAAIVADYLLDYPIERGAIPMRAPETSSSVEAVSLSRGPIERSIMEAVEDGIAGFCGGWVSATAVANRLKATGAVRGGVSATTIATVIETLGYRPMGRASRPWFQEDRESRPYLFYRGPGVPHTDSYGPAQGYSLAMG